MSRHFLELADAATLPTESLQLVHQTVDDLLDAGAMGVVHGPAGLGKTFAVEETLARVGTVEVVWSVFPTRPTMRLVAATLLEQLTGQTADRASRFTLLGLLVEALARPKRVIVTMRRSG